MRCCYKYLRGLLMARHAQTNCFLLFTYNQSLPQFGATRDSRKWGRGGVDPTGMGLRALGCLLLVCKSFLPRETKPSLCPSLAWPMLSHSLLPSPRKLLEGMVYSTDSPALLSPSLLYSFHLPRPSHTTCPRPTPHGSLARAWSQPPSSSVDSRTSQKTELSLRYLLLHQPSILDTPNPLIFTTKTYLEFICSSP